MLENKILNLRFAAGNAVDIYVFIFATKQDTDCANSLRAGQSVKHAIGGRENCCCPALIFKRRWQVTHDVTNAADLAAFQRAVFGCQEDDVLDTDSRCPELTREMQVLAQHVGRHERKPRLGYTEAAFPVCICVFTDDRPRRDL